MNKCLRACGLFCLIAMLAGCSSANSPVDQIVDARIEAENGGGTDRGTVVAKDVRESAGQPGSSSPEGTVRPEDGTVRAGLDGAQPEHGKTQPVADDGSGIDVDLTKMSSVMVYSEVYNIMMKPDDYLGKIIKIGGPYYASYWEETGNYYHYVIIEDATACCTEGLEFIWDGGTHTFPDEYPEDYAAVEIVGTFGMYEEEGMTFYYLDTEEIVCK